MLSKKSMCLALAALACVALSSNAAIITAANKAKVKNTAIKTTTSGQKQILLKIDPYNVSSFSLDVQFDAGKVTFDHIEGINGYTIDDYNVTSEGSFGLISQIHGFYPGFEDVSAGSLAIASATTSVVTAIKPPPGRVDIFQIFFTLINQNPGPFEFTEFTTFASGDGYINGFNPETNETTHIESQDIESDTTRVLLAGPYTGGPGGGNGVPLPGALAMGLAAGAGVFGNVIRRRR